MHITPTLEEVKPFTECGKYDVMPLSCALLSDALTPIQALRILRSVSDHCYILESLSDADSWGRYTFLGYDPKLEITCIDGDMRIGDHHFHTNDPSQALRALLRQNRSPRIKTLPPFTGGLVGYFAYEYLYYSEPGVWMQTRDPDQFKDLDLMLFDTVIVFDHLCQQLILIANMRLDEELPAAYAAASQKLKMMAALLKKEVPACPPGHMKGAFEALFDGPAYCQMVDQAKDYIREGDLFQIVLSNRLSVPYEGSLLNMYRVLRTQNPSPYMFYLSGCDIEVAGASPETLIRLDDGVLRTFPLAGTRGRGRSVEEDLRLEQELLSDEKELAEHDMLIDLGRNDLGKISRFGSVQAERLHSIERFSCVMHIGSAIRGELREGLDALDAVAAILPAGTLSGAPKLRAVQRIAQLEDSRRGIYGGALGYIDFTGNMDMCIAIRLAYRKNGQVFIRSGAGIVADSQGEREHEECIRKASAVVKALKQAEEVE